MPDIILLCAGSSSRFKLGVKKQWLRIKNNPLWLHNAYKFKKFFPQSNIIIVSNEQDIGYMRKIEPNFIYVVGGNLRQKSLQNALNLVKSEFVIVSDVARIFSKKLIKNLLKKFHKDNKFHSYVPYLNVVDTAYLGENLINRDDLKLIQTPGIHKTSSLKTALDSDEIFSDESSAIKFLGERICFVKGSKKAIKITYKKDLKNIKLPKPSDDIFIGQGFDLHRISNKANSKISLCGIDIKSDYEIIAHSDGDVGIHALIDGILGAIKLGDIGELFPDTDERYKNISSIKLLENVIKRVRSYGFVINSIDITLIIQSPKLMDYKDLMREKIINLTNCKNTNIKATTSEGIGIVGRNEAIVAMSVVSVKFYNWRDDL